MGFDNLEKKENNDEKVKDNSSNSEKVFKWVFPKYIVFIIGIIIVSLVISFIIISSGNFKVEKNIITVEAGEDLDANKIYTPKNKNAIVTVDTSNVNFDKAGVYDIEYSVRYKDRIKTFEDQIEVIDTKAPVIEGNDYIYVEQRSDFAWSDYLIINDAEDISADKITTDKEFNINVVGEYELNLQIADSAGNTGEKKVTLNVFRPTEEELAGAKAINYLLENNQIKEEELSLDYINNINCYSDNGICIVKINEFYVCVDIRGEDVDFTMDLESAVDLVGTTYSYSFMKIMVDTVSENQNIEKILSLV